MSSQRRDSIKGVVCFGDSIFAGIGATDRQLGCSKLVKTSFLVPVSLKGRNRDTSANALARLGDDVLSQKDYSHVLILFGNNDGWLKDDNQPQVSLNEFEKNIKVMLTQIIKNNQKPILLNLQPLDSKRFFKKYPMYLEKKDSVQVDPIDWQKQYNDRISKIADEECVDFINIRSGLENNIYLHISDDGLHPTDLGHKLIADTIINYLKNIDRSVTAESDTSAR